MMQLIHSQAWRLIDGLGHMGSAACATEPGRARRLLHPRPCPHTWTYTTVAGPIQLHSLAGPPGTIRRTGLRTGSQQVSIRPHRGRRGEIRPRLSLSLRHMESTGIVLRLLHLLFRLPQPRHVLGSIAMARSTSMPITTGLFEPPWLGQLRSSLNRRIRVDIQSLNESARPNAGVRIFRPWIP